MKIKKFSSSTIISLIIISFAVSPAFALGSDQRNLLLIGMMSLSPIVLFFFGDFKNKFDGKDLLLFLFLFSLFLFQFLVNPERLRLSTIIYTLMFGLTFMTFKQLIYRNYYTIEDYQKLLKYLIYAYVLVLLIQQFCVLTNLPIFNVSNYRPEEKWKLNTLTSEPSHSARIVGLLMFSYISVIELIKKRKYSFRSDYKGDKWIWFSFLWTMLTMGSGTSFLFIGLVFFKFIKIKNLLPLGLLFMFILLVVNSFEITSFERTYQTILATLTLNPAKIFEADGSAAYRIVPIIILAQKVGFSTLSDWFGYGIDYVGSFLSSEVPGLPEGWTGGGLFQVWMDYGFISFMLFMMFNFFQILKKANISYFIFWFMLVFIQGLNNQILWLCIVLLFTNSYFKNKASLYKIKLQ